LLLALALVASVVDWAAVGAGSHRLEYVAKPLTPILLIGAALALHIDEEAARDAVVVGLAFSLAGDIALMLPHERGFLVGLAAFLCAHVAYVVAFWLTGVSLTGVVVGLVVVAIGVLVLARRVLAGVERTDPALLGPVGAYVAVISAMVASAIATVNPLFVIGALLFYASDLMIAWSRFLDPLRRGPVAIMVTYHLAQFGFVLGLLAA
jgi:uncharacterized membrane protein YhhN